MKTFRIHTSTESTNRFIISSDTRGFYIALSDIHTIRSFINDATAFWSINYATDMGDLLAEFDTFDELVDNYPEYFV